MRRVQQQVSKLQQDNATLQREKTELEAKLKAVEGELSKSKQQAGRLRKSATALEAAEKDNSDLRLKIAAGEERLKDTTQRCNEQIASGRREIGSALATLAEVKVKNEQDLGNLHNLLQGESARAGACEAKNQQLYQVTMDLVGRYKQNRGAWEKFLLSEPFTQLKSVQVENLLQEMREKAVEAKVDSRAENASARSNP